MVRGFLIRTAAWRIVVRGKLLIAAEGGGGGGGGGGVRICTADVKIVSCCLLFAEPLCFDILLVAAVHPVY